MTTADQQIPIKLDQIKAAQGGGAAGVTDVIGTAPIASSGGMTPDISIAPATTSDPGSMSAADKTKLDNAPADPQSAAQVANAIATSGGKLLDTTGAPDNGVGANGDYAFDDATKTIYGPKAAGVWPAGVVLGASGGVIGTMFLTIDNAGEATVDFVDGIFVGTASPFAAVSSGILTVTFPAGQPDANYFPELIITDSQGDAPITVIIPEVSIVAGSFTAQLIISNTGALSTDQVNKVRIKVSRLSQ